MSVGLRRLLALFRPCGRLNASSRKLRFGKCNDITDDACIKRQFSAGRFIEFVKYKRLVVLLGQTTEVQENMITWLEFQRLEPELAEGGRQMLYQFGGVGLGFLSTIRPDAGPRLHPICPIITPAGLFAMIIPSPKRRDLIRDGRFAMHSFPTDHNEDAFYVTGRALPVESETTGTAVRDQFFSERPAMDRTTLSQDQPFEFLLESALLTRTTGIGDVNPKHQVWRLA